MARWQTPPESPDLNPIENVWHELKVIMAYSNCYYTIPFQEYLRREVKPKNQRELIEGIKSFWQTVDVTKCRLYRDIEHVKVKVVPKVIAVNGAATRY